MVPESFIPTYEPLGLLLLISMGLRRLRLARSAQEQVASTQPGLLAIDGDSIQPGLPKADTLDGLGSSEKDEPNTYLSSEALRLPGRQCALCFEPRGTSEDSRGTVAVTECGHVFCWGCLGGLEKVGHLAVDLRSVLILSPGRVPLMSPRAEDGAIIGGL